MWDEELVKKKNKREFVVKQKMMREAPIASRKKKSVKDGWDQSSGHSLWERVSSCDWFCAPDLECC